MSSFSFFTGVPKLVVVDENNVEHVEAPESSVPLPCGVKRGLRISIKRVPVTAPAEPAEALDDVDPSGPTEALDDVDPSGPAEALDDVDPSGPPVITKEEVVAKLVESVTQKNDEFVDTPIVVNEELLATPFKNLTPQQAAAAAAEARMAATSSRGEEDENFDFA